MMPTMFMTRVKLQASTCIAISAQPAAAFFHQEVGRPNGLAVLTHSLRMMLVQPALHCLEARERCFGTSPIQTEKFRPNRRPSDQQHWQPGPGRHRESHRAACLSGWIGAKP
jgi:hypothetical protein